MVTLGAENTALQPFTSATSSGQTTPGLEFPRVCFINVTVAAGMKPNHLFKNITVKNTNRSVRSTITTTLKEELKSRVADQHWKSSPTRRRRSHSDPEAQRGHLHPVSTTSRLVAWLVESYAEYHFFGMQEGQTSIEMLFLGKQKLCLEGKKTLWMKQQKNLRYKYLQSRFMLQVPWWLYLDLIQQRYWKKPHK